MRHKATFTWFSRINAVRIMIYGVINIYSIATYETIYTEFWNA